MTRTEFLAALVSDLSGYWIEITCGSCSVRVGLPCKLLAKTHGRLRVSEVLPRLRCSRCQGKPSNIRAMNHPAGRTQQYADTWVEEL